MSVSIISVRIDEEERELIAEYATAHGTNVGYLVRKLLRLEMRLYAEALPFVEDGSFEQAEEAMQYVQLFKLAQAQGIAPEKLHALWMERRVGQTQTA